MTGSHDGEDHDDDDDALGLNAVTEVQRAHGAGETWSVTRAELRWTDAAGAHRVAVGTRAVVGSAPASEVCVADSMVSRLHAELERRADGLWVRDLGSRNGTEVDGVRVGLARLVPGSRLRVGRTDIAVGAEPRPTSIPLHAHDHFGPLVGRSVAMRELFARLSRCAASDATVLIEGETGTGKELVAQALHEASPRARGPFVVVDCAALPENLLESELFGHARGAFTGAVSARAGAAEQAEGGTLFLDEIGELPLALQPKLLRLLESRAARRLGEAQHRKVDVRFVSATHRDLRTMVNRGAFREDLYFRLAVLPVTVPPLRDRPDDVPALAQHFLARMNAHASTLAPDLMAELRTRPWVGNVRELRNFVERAVALGSEEAARLAPVSAAPGRGVTEVLPPVSADEPFRVVRERWTDHLERAYLTDALARHKGNVSAVAEASGLDRSYVHRLIKKHGL